MITPYNSQKEKNMERRGVTLIEILTVIAVAVVLVSLCAVAVKTFRDCYEIKGSLPAIDSILGLAKYNAKKTGYYAGVYFYDQNEAACAMEVIEKQPADYSLPYIEMVRMDGRPIHALGQEGLIRPSVVLFTKTGRLAIKDVGAYGYRNFSDRSLQVGDVNYPINTYTGRLVR